MKQCNTNGLVRTVIQRMTPMHKLNRIIAILLACVVVFSSTPQLSYADYIVPMNNPDAEILTIVPNGKQGETSPQGYIDGVPYHDGTDGWYTFVQLRAEPKYDQLYKWEFFDGYIVFSVKSKRDKDGYRTDGTGIIEIYNTQKQLKETIAFDNNEHGNSEFIYREDKGILRKKTVMKNLFTWNKDSVSIGDQPYKTSSFFSPSTVPQLANFRILYNYPRIFTKEGAPFYADGWLKPKNHDVNVIYKELADDPDPQQAKAHAKEIKRITLHGLTGMRYRSLIPSQLDSDYEYVESSEPGEGYLSPWNKPGDTLTKRVQPYMDIRYTLLDMKGRMRWELFYDGQLKQSGELADTNANTSFNGTAKNGRPYTQRIENPFIPHANDIIHYYRRKQPPAQIIVEYYDETTKTILKTEGPIFGTAGTPIEYSSQAQVNDYQNQGYELVKNTLTKGSRFGKPGTKQTYRITFKHATRTETQTQTFNRTIHYRYESKQGKVAHEDNQQHITFKRTVHIDRVTNKPLNTTDWNSQAPSVFDKVPSPSIDGYTPDRSEVEALRLKADDAIRDREEWVIYRKIADAHVQVQYIDKTNANKMLEQSDNIAGQPNTAVNYSTKATIEKYRNKGYKLVSDAYPPHAQFGKSGTSTVYKVILEHDTETLNPKHPGDPKKPINPKDPKSPKYPAGTDRASLEATVKRTIRYRYDNQNGKQAANDNVDQVSFEREVVIDKVTGAIIQDHGFKAVKSDTTFDAVSSPVIANYQPDKPIVEAVNNIRHTDKDQMVTVVYTKIPAVTQRAIVRYVDHESGKELANDELNGESGAKISYTTADRIAAFKKQGYDLVSDDFTRGEPQHFDRDEKRDQIFLVRLTPRIETVTPKTVKPTPDTPVNPQDPNSPRWPCSVEGLEKLEKSIKRTIHYRYENGVTVFDDNISRVEYQRVAHVNLVTGAIQYDAWKTDNASYPLVKSPYKVGYSADRREIPAVSEVKVTDSDTEEIVTYSPHEEDREAAPLMQLTVRYVDVQGNQLSDSLVSGATYREGDAYTTEAKLISGYFLTEVPVNKSGKFANASIVVTYVYKPLAKLVPKSEDPEFPKTDPVVYPNDPTDPMKPGRPLVPVVPQYTPYHEDVNHPGKPDLSRPITPGEPITPEHPDVDTPIVYVKNKSPRQELQPRVQQYTLTVRYVDVQGNQLSDPLVSGATYREGDAYTTEAKVLDGYRLVATPENASGIFPADSVEVKYVYQVLPRVPSERRVSKISLRSKRGCEREDSCKDTFRKHRMEKSKVSYAVNVRRIGKESELAVTGASLAPAMYAGSVTAVAFSLLILIRSARNQYKARKKD